MLQGQYDGDFTSICNVLYCDDGSGSCYTNIAGDGTHCGNKKVMNQTDVSTLVDTIA